MNQPEWTQLISLLHKPILHETEFALQHSTKQSYHCAQKEDLGCLLLKNQAQQCVSVIVCCFLYRSLMGALLLQVFLR